MRIQGRKSGPQIVGGARYVSRGKNEQRKKPDATSATLESLLKYIRQIIGDKKYYPLTPGGAQEIIEYLKDMLYSMHIKIAYENL